MQQEDIDLILSALESSVKAVAGAAAVG